MEEARELNRLDLERMNIPKEYWTVVIEKVPESTREPIANCIDSIETLVDTGFSVLVQGPTGVGKTSIAALLGKAARRYRRSVYFTTLWELKEDVQNRSRFDGESSVLQRCMDVDLLIVDDVAPEATSKYGFIMGDFAPLIHRRMQSRKANVLTSSVSEDVLLSIPGFERLVQSQLLPMRVVGPNKHEERVGQFADHIFKKRD